MVPVLAGGGYGDEEEPTHKLNDFVLWDEENVGWCEIERKNCAFPRFGIESEAGERAWKLIKLNR